MIRRDYIERLIEQLAQAIAAVVLNKRQHNYDRAREEIKRACNGLLGVQYDLVRALSTKDLLGILKINPDQAPDKCRILGELLQHDAEIYQLGGRAEDYVTSLHKALYLYIEAYKTLGDKYGLKRKIDGLAQESSGQVIPDFLQEALSHYRSLNK